MAKEEKKVADPEKFENPAPTGEGTPEGGNGDGTPEAGEPNVSSLEAQMADMRATLSQQATIINKLTSPKGIQSAKEPFKLDEQPATQRELAEKELRKYVKVGGHAKDLVDGKMVKVEPGYRKGVTSENKDRAKVLIKFLNEKAGKDGLKRNPNKPQWDLAILGADHKRTQL